MYMYVCTCMYVCMCAYAVWFSKQPEAKRGIKKFLKRYVCMLIHVSTYTCTCAHMLRGSQSSLRPKGEPNF